MANIKPYKTSWRVVVRRVGYPARTKVCRTKKEAEIWGRDIEYEMDNLTYRNLAAAPKESVSDLFLRYAEEVSPTRKGVRWEVTRINMLLKNAEFTKRRLSQIRPEDIRDWRDQRLQQVSAPTVQRELNLISGIFTHAIKEWSSPIAVNPVKLISRPKFSNRLRARRFTDQELQKLLDAAGFDPQHRPTKGREMVPWALLLALETAMRPSELTALCVRDFHPDERCVRLADAKNGFGRDVPLSSKAMEYLTFICEGREPDEPIIGMQWETLGVYYRELRKKAGLEKSDLRFRDMRHEAATRLSKKFANQLELAAVTGHRSLQSLKRYFNPTAAELAAKMD